MLLLRRARTDLQSKLHAPANHTNADVVEIDAVAVHQRGALATAVPAASRALATAATAAAAAAAPATPHSSSSSTSCCLPAGHLHGLQQAPAQ